MMARGRDYRPGRRRRPAASQVVAVRGSHDVMGGVGGLDFDGVEAAMVMLRWPGDPQALALNLVALDSICPPYPYDPDTRDGSRLSVVLVQQAGRLHTLYVGNDVNYPDGPVDAFQDKLAADVSLSVDPGDIARWRNAVQARGGCALVLADMVGNPRPELFTAWVRNVKYVPADRP